MARVTRRRSLVLDKQKRFQLSSELGETVRWVQWSWSSERVKQAVCSKAAVRRLQTTCRPDEFWSVRNMCDCVCMYDVDDDSWWTDVGRGE